MLINFKKILNTCNNKNLYFKGLKQKIIQENIKRYFFRYYNFVKKKIQFYIKYIHLINDT